MGDQLKNKNRAYMSLIRENRMKQKFNMCRKENSELQFEVKNMSGLQEIEEISAILLEIEKITPETPAVDLERLLNSANRRIYNLDKSHVKNLVILVLESTIFKTLQERLEVDEDPFVWNNTTFLFALLMDSGVPMLQKDFFEKCCEQFYRRHISSVHSDDLENIMTAWGLYLQSNPSEIGLLKAELFVENLESIVMDFLNEVDLDNLQTLTVFGYYLDLLNIFVQTMSGPENMKYIKMIKSMIRLAFAEHENVWMKVYGHDLYIVVLSALKRANSSEIEELVENEEFGALLKFAIDILDGTNDCQIFRFPAFTKDLLEMIKIIIFSSSVDLCYFLVQNSFGTVFRNITNEDINTVGIMFETLSVFVIKMAPQFKSVDSVKAGFEECIPNLYEIYDFSFVILHNKINRCEVIMQTLTFHFRLLTMRIEGFNECCKRNPQVMECYLETAISKSLRMKEKEMALACVELLFDYDSETEDLMADWIAKNEHSVETLHYIEDTSSGNLKAIAKKLLSVIMEAK